MAALAPLGRPLKEQDGHISLRHVASARRNHTDNLAILQQRQPHLGFLPLPKHPFFGGGCPPRPSLEAGGQHPFSEYGRSSVSYPRPSSAWGRKTNNVCSANFKMEK